MTEQADSPNVTTTDRSKTRRIVAVLMPLLIVAAGVLLARHFITNRPEVKKRPPQRTTTLVEVLRVSRVSTNVTVPAMGSVTAARAITLRSRVGGEVVHVSDHFIEGAFVQAGEELLRIDPMDYELAVARAEASLVQANYEVRLESGRQKVATREWALLKPDEPVSEEERQLALREPHLERVKAGQASAEAALQSAKLDLERTVIRTPFNAVITARHTELGEQVSAQAALADLSGTDASWVRTAVPLDRLPWIIIPRRDGDPASNARVILRQGGGTSQAFDGKVVRLLGDVEAQGRMAQLLVQIEDPFGLGSESDMVSPLLLGGYVRVEIEGKTIHDVVAIPRAALRDGDRVWLAGPDDQLETRYTDVVWRGPEEVLLRSGLEEGDRLIVSDIAAPVEGMLLNVIGTDPERDRHPTGATDAGT